MRVKEYRVLEECVERGFDYGWQRAHKHTDTPDEDLIKADVLHAVMREVCDYFAFGADEEEQ